jgi:Ca-activated chloride channel family protein
MIHFAWPWMLLLLPLPWIFTRFLPPVRPQGAALFLPFAASVAGDSAPTLRSLPRVRTLLFVLVWLLLIAAAARPKWCRKWPAISSAAATAIASA